MQHLLNVNGNSGTRTRTDRFPTLRFIAVFKPKAKCYFLFKQTNTIEFYVGSVLLTKNKTKGKGI